MSKIVIAQGSCAECGRKGADGWAEVLPWRCHRRLIADAMIIRGFQVYDIIGACEPAARAIAPFAKIMENRLCYPLRISSPA